MMIRTYDTLIQFSTFAERFNYLKLDGNVGKTTFGFDRYINQNFYRSKKWKGIRDFVIVRDLGCDLGIEDRILCDEIVVHHMNPIRINDIEDMNEFVLDPKYLITTCKVTHNAIHYGDSNILSGGFVERTPYDTCPWKITNKGEKSK